MKKALAIACLLFVSGYFYLKKDLNVENETYVSQEKSMLEKDIKQEPLINREKPSSEKSIETKTTTATPTTEPSILKEKLNLLLKNPNLNEEQAKEIVESILENQDQANQILWESFESEKNKKSSYLLNSIGAFLLNFEENHSRLNREMSNLLDKIEIKDYQGDTEMAIQDDEFNKHLSLHSLFLQSSDSAERAYFETLNWVNSSRNEFYKESLLTQFMSQFPDYVEQNQEEFCKNLDGKICN